MAERRKRKPVGSSAKHGSARAQEPAKSSESSLGTLIDSISGLRTDFASSALKLAALTRRGAVRVVSRTPEQLRMMASAGESLRDLREVAGMTVGDISEALSLRDKSVWEAVEDGSEVLSIELILRLASLVARNDPLPFVLKYVRTYNPRIAQVLQDLKIDLLPVTFERERNFINIYRRHDMARQLSDADFEQVLKFTQSAFDTAIHFVAAQEDDTESPEREDKAQPRNGRRIKSRSR